MANGNNNGRLLYQKLRAQLCSEIFHGRYADGDPIPTERRLATGFGVSRVTVRKTLGMLEEEGLLLREQGRGTRFTACKGGFKGDMELIALVAPADNPFFAEFMHHFDIAADKEDSLVLFKHVYAEERQFEDYLLRLYLKDIRDFVLWPYSREIPPAFLDRLRGLGSNIVIFDRIEQAAADCVSVDNHHAIRTLYACLAQQGMERIGYVGWADYPVSSTVERLQAYQDVSPPPAATFSLPWHEEQFNEADVDALISEVLQSTPPPEGLICGNGNIGIWCARKLREMGRDDIRVVCVDNLPGSEELGLTAYEQPHEKMARTVFDRLCAQNRKADAWKPDTCYVRGNLFVRNWIRR